MDGALGADDVQRLGQRPVKAVGDVAGRCGESAAQRACVHQWCCLALLDPQGQHLSTVTTIRHRILLFASAHPKSMTAFLRGVPGHTNVAPPLMTTFSLFITEPAHLDCQMSNR